MFATGSRLLVLIGFVFISALGCAATESKATANTMKIAPGVYEATISGSRKARITVDEALGYRYIEDSTRNGLIRQVQRKGTLRFTTWRKAKAGNIRLEWVSQDTIKVVSPFSSTIGNGNNEGNMAYSSGPFLTGMPSHTFYMNRISAE
ncbi:MAG: hypothetical protein OXG25_06960 [Gammaproteobacteria bacterium]|nr:hypothetical protein [Gammaproteobacteria bacterium]